MAKSQGPVNVMGKSISARNALRHGLTAHDLTLSNEDQAAFDLVLADYMDEICPTGVIETNLVEEIAYAKWRKYRSWTTETAIYNLEIAANREKLDQRLDHFAEPVRTADALESSLARTGSLPHLHRCETRINRQYSRALNTLLAIRANNGIAETNPGISLKTNESASEPQVEPDTAESTTPAVKAII